MIPNAIEVSIDAKHLKLEQAKLVADQKASEISESHMLLAWYDKKTGTYSPRVECCNEEKPGWLVYAESRGGQIIIDINSLEYVFVYLAG